MFDILSDIITGPNPMIWILFFYLLFINLKARKNYTIDFNKAIITSLLFIAGALYNFFYDKTNLSLSYVALVVCILLLATSLSFYLSKSYVSVVNKTYVDNTNLGTNNIGCKRATNDKITNFNRVDYTNKNNKSLQVKGSFIPLFIFLTFFIIKFVFGFFSFFFIYF